MNFDSRIIDCNFSYDEALRGLKIPGELRQNLELIEVEYLSFDNKIHQGQVVINRIISEELKEIFQKLEEVEFAIEKVIPIVKYSWNDESSMKDNNSSAFNYRYIKGTKRLSNHSFGLAIDINPLLNPFIGSDGVLFPKNAVYDKNKPGTISASSDVVSIFKSFGWHWGGDWTSIKDYQHFEET